jgi:hypothetical protein
MAAGYSVDAKKRMVCIAHIVSCFFAHRLYSFLLDFKTTCAFLKIPSTYSKFSFMRNIITLIVASACALFFTAFPVCGQLIINGGGFTIDSGAIVNVKGDLTGSSNIAGSGKVIMNGTTSQYLGLNGYSVPALEINNAQNITLTSAAKVQSALVFVNGRIIAGNNNFVLSSSAAASGMGTGKFVETNGTGQVVKELTSDITSFEMPVGISTVYRPVFLTSAAASYAAAQIGIKASAVASINRPSFASDYLNAYWSISRTGITGTVNATGQYTDPADITGAESKLRGCFYDGSQWSNTMSSYDASLNRVGAQVASGGGTLYGMSPFAMLGVKAFLQGAYTSNAMNSCLYSLGLHSDPTAADSVNIELWSSSGLSNPAAAFSYKALLHTDGNVSVLLPESAIGNSYYLALKHRNSMETWSALTVPISGTVSYDFTSAASQAYGNNLAAVNGGYYALYSGDVNQDGIIEASDYARMENDLLAGLTGYQAADITGNGVVELSDHTLMENNILKIIFRIRP